MRLKKSVEQGFWTIQIEESFVTTMAKFNDKINVGLFSPCHEVSNGRDGFEQEDVKVEYAAAELVEKDVGEGVGQVPVIVVVILELRSQEPLLQGGMGEIPGKVGNSTYLSSRLVCT